MCVCRPRPRPRGRRRVVVVVIIIIIYLCGTSTIIATPCNTNIRMCTSTGWLTKFPEKTSQHETSSTVQFL